jgi:hypothetical protein
MTTQSFDMKKAVAEVPGPLAFWMGLSMVKAATANAYSYNKDRFERLAVICDELQVIANEMKAEKEQRLKAAADRTAQAAAIAAGKA